MKTLNIDDSVMARLRREAVRSGRTMSEPVETALRGLLQSRRADTDIEPLPTFHSSCAHRFRPPLRRARRRYRIKPELGAGGKATVYLAADERHSGRVTIR